MRETAEDLRRLQDLLDRSDAGAGEHLRSIFDDRHRLSADDLVDRLDGVFEMHLAVVTGSGAPLVAPIDGIFYRGQIWFGLPAGSVRAGLVRADPRVSASYTEGSFAFIAHGTAHAVDNDHPEAAAYEALVKDLYVAQYGPGWLDWYESPKQTAEPGSGFSGFIEPRVLFVKR